MNSTILVVENDVSVCQILKEVLETNGYLVETAETLDEAALFMAGNEPDLIFAAFELEHGHGDELLHEARRNGYDVPVVLITNSHIENSAEVVAGTGAMTYLRKPVKRARLESVARQGIVIKQRMVQERLHTSESALPRRFLGALLDTGDEAFFLLDDTGELVQTNKAGADFLGMEPDELCGRKYVSLLPVLSAKLQEKAIGKVGDSCQPTRIEEHRSGAIYSTTIRPVLDNGLVVGFVVATRDITAQRRSEVGLAESEKRYRSVYEAARDAIIMIDRNDGSILDSNAAARNLYNYSAEEMLHLTIMDLSDSPDYFLDAIRSGVERTPLRHHRRSDGFVFPVEVSMSHFVHDGREVCTAYIQDISQRKVVEEALREGARLYRAVVEDQTELICRYQVDGKLTFVNTAYARFFDVDDDEVVGRNLFPRLDSLTLRLLKNWLKKVRPSDSVMDHEQKYALGDNEFRWVRWTNRAIFDHRGVVVEIQAIGRDVTERKNAEEALGKATAEKERYRLNLEATFRSIPDAIVSVDSDLRIIATNSAAGSLLGMDLDQAQGHDLEKLIDAQGNSCVSVLRQVLETSKPVWGYEIKFNSPTLGERMVEINCSPLINETKEYTGAVLIVRDVSRIADLEKRLHDRHGFRGIVGRTSVMQDIYNLLEQLSSLDSIVLVLGESGTGKELVADALHYGGARAGRPFVKVNCSALSESLLESELFGHVRGAFTGAVQDKVGRIQAAQGGTLFLDEIGDISPLLQLKLLRFLEQKEYERVGESVTHTADVRIIAATNANLKDLVRQGSFREDLYYRLNVMPVFIPPLRERQADIPMLVEYFLEIFSDQFNKGFDGLSAEVMDLFMSYHWPGNIRELRHLLEHACILSPGGAIGLGHVRKDLVDQMATNKASERESSESFFERPVQLPRKAGKADVLTALERCGGNKAKAARQLGIHRATLYRKLAAWGVTDA